MSTKRKFPTLVDRTQLRSLFDRLEGQSGRFLMRWRLRAELRAAAAGALLGLFVLPLALLLFQTASGLMGRPQSPVSVWTIVALAVLGPLLYVFTRLTWSYVRYRPTRFAALALYDAELKSQDRLVTADEFIDAGSADECALAA